MFSSIFSPSENEIPRRTLRVYRLRVGLLVAALLAHALMLSGVLDVIAGMIAFAAAAVGYTVLTVAYWRCPHCGRYPGNSVRPDYCERCGEGIFGLDTTMEQNTEIAVEHRRRGSIMTIVVLRFVSGTALLVLFIILGAHGGIPESTFLWIVFGTAVLTAWIEWRLWRCPNCRGYLPRSIWPGKTCRKCGSELWG